MLCCWEQILIFQRIITYCLQSPAPKMTALQSFQKSGTTHPMTQNHIPEEMKHQQTQCENLKTCIFGHTYSGNFSLFPFISRNIHACTSLTHKDHKLWRDPACAADLFNVLTFNIRRFKSQSSPSGRSFFGHLNLKIAGLQKIIYIFRFVCHKVMK